MTTDQKKKNEVKSITGSGNKIGAMFAKNLSIETQGTNVGQAIRKKMIKQTNNIPTRQKLTKTQEEIDKAKNEPKHVQDLGLLNDAKK